MENDISWIEKDTFASKTSRGFIAGIAGGLAGTAVKMLIERVLPVRRPNTRSAQEKLVDSISETITGDKLSDTNKELAAQLVNLPFAASIGASYGYAKREKPEFNAMEGAFLGASTWVGTHEVSLPALDLKNSPDEIPLKYQASELLAHVAFGITTELVRSFVMQKLEE
ncbi:hypothetical protein GCM10009117_22230 [Gangjinia marincola]|uniref:DUF1440 domain-containing protein n=1 Tax=Gangjinia marincola TaxID=578463 RepID=A0ABN1MIP8_9FLAO